MPVAMPAEELMTSSDTTDLWSSSEDDAESGVETLEQFLMQAEQRAFRIVRYAVGHDEDALDIVQDAMFKLVRRYSKRPSSEWAPLFHRILQNGIRDHWRRQNTRNRWFGWLSHFRSESDDDGELPTDQWIDENSLDGERQLEVDQNIAAIETAIRALPPRQQQVFLLRCWEGLSTRETAEAMGCSEGSVKTHYFRALNALKKALTVA